MNEFPQKEQLSAFIISKLEAAKKEVENGKFKTIEEAEHEIDNWLNETVNLNPAQMDELERRLESMEKGDMKMKTWEEVRSKLLNNFSQV